MTESRACRVATTGPVAAAVVVSRTLRRRLPAAAADSRGIALQTVIVIVVLLAVAGAVSGVLLTRGQEGVTELERERQPVGQPADYMHEDLCVAAKWYWHSAPGPRGGSCQFAPRGP